MTADDSAHFADILAAASSNANTNVALMGESFKYVASVADAMSLTMQSGFDMKFDGISGAMPDGESD